MDEKKLKDIIEKHKKWLFAESGGERANLYGVNLSGTNLSGANLSRATMSGTNLSGANLSRADLSGANLSGANLSGANLHGTNLYIANLSGANLSRADLSIANLSGANLSRATMSGTNLYGASLSRTDLSGAKIEIELLNKFFPICCPEHGSFTAWKKSSGYIVKLEVTESAKRSSAYGRQCRCSEAKVLGIETIDGTAADRKEVKSGYDSKFIYRVGETVRVDNFDEDRRNECAPGIHFFITRQEAVDY